MTRLADGGGRRRERNAKLTFSRVDNGEDFARDGAIAKLYSAETAQEIVDEALQSFGGPGVVHDGSRISRNIIHSYSVRPPIADRYGAGSPRRSVANSTVKARGADGGTKTETSPDHSFLDHAARAPAPLSASASAIAWPSSRTTFTAPSMPWKCRR